MDRSRSRLTRNHGHQVIDLLSTMSTQSQLGESPSYDTEAQVLATLVDWARIALWAVVATAGIKLSEVFGPGEQSWASQPPAVDLLFKCAVFLAAVFACGVAVASGKVRRASLTFVPFLVWTFVVTVILQADNNAAKQVGAYASWILFYVASCSLLDGPDDFKMLVRVMTVSVFLSALGGQVQHWLGYGPTLGSMWAESAEMEYKRIHTGAGGILTDTFTPYCAAILLLASAGKSRWKQAGACLLILWGTANILRGGMVALAFGMCWFLWMVSPQTRKRILPFLIVGVLCGLVLFGATVSDKMFGRGDEVNTSGRLDVWPQLLEWIAEAPLLGHGPDADLDLLANSAGGQDLRVSHNELLSTGVNYGVTGILLLWGPLIVLLLRSLVRTARAGPSEREQLSAASTVLLMIVLLSLTDNTLRSPGIMILALAPISVTSQWEPKRARFLMGE